MCRTYRRCAACEAGAFPADAALDPGRSPSERARRTAILLGLEESFARAGRLLRAAAGCAPSPEALRRPCHAEAAALRRERPGRLDTAARSADAPGDWELQVDAGKVNTPGGWRDVKVAAFARPGRSEASDSAGYERRDLPSPRVHAVVAEVEAAGGFGHRCQVESMRLRRLPGGPLSILGDGAEWVWAPASRRSAGAEGVLDIFHSCENLAELARAAWGDEASSRAWLDRALRALVVDGWAGVCQLVAAEAHPDPLRAAYPAVANYLLGHRDRPGYAARLARGQSIGSGPIEGAIGQRVGRRMKRIGARWLAPHVGPFVELSALAGSPDWGDYW